eukprot:7723809-Lingulodinium_polyedra.AAC.1
MSRTQSRSGPGPGQVVQSGSSPDPVHVQSRPSKVKSGPALSLSSAVQCSPVHSNPVQTFPVH